MQYSVIYAFNLKIGFNVMRKLQDLKKKLQDLILLEKLQDLIY